MGAFFALAVLHSGQRSTATPPFIQLCQDEKPIPYLLDGIYKKGMPRPLTKKQVHPINSGAPVF